MPIKRLTTDAEISRFIDEKVKRIEKALVYNLSYVGEQVLNKARSTNSYKDQTGNLRSSIGFVVAIDGKIKKMSDFEIVKNGADGAKSGKAYARELVKNYPQGICLIVVAGVDYAVHVSNRGYDVLDGSELLAERLVPQMLAQLLTQINESI